MRCTYTLTRLTNKTHNIIKACMVYGRFIDDKPLTLSEHGWVCVFYCVSHMMFLFSIRAFHLLLFSSYSLLLSKALSVFFLNASHVKLHEFGKSVETKCFRNSVLYSKSTQCCKSFQFRLQAILQYARLPVASFVQTR